MSKKLAYYLRLSLDDGNSGESNSIASQREIIKEYICCSDEFAEKQTLEFIDDGYSGTNFNRPGIKKLLETVKKGEIDCIIVKDFSRFGRQYLEVGKYIEKIFPYTGVRFIAVNDNYDSNKYKGAAAEIDVPIRNMINAMYSIDISKKVKSAKNTKIKQGAAAGAFAIYGYRKDAADKGQVVIDEPAAAVVRRVFQLARDGNGTFKIAEILNNECIPTPSVYKNKTGDIKKWTNISEENVLWTTASVLRILRDERYTGTFVGGMWEAGKLGSNENKIKPKEEWVRIPNSHPAVITREFFDKTAETIQGKPGVKIKKISRPLDKKVWCAKCGHKLRYRGDTSRPFYFCGTIRYSEKHGCMRGKIREKDLDGVVIETLLAQIKFFTDNEKMRRMIKNNINKPDIALKDNSILRLGNEIINLQSAKRKLYERYKNKEINQNLYLKEREVLEIESTGKITERESLLFQQKNDKITLETTRQIITRSFLEYKSITELTKEIADEFIESVKIYDRDRIEIRFAFKDEFENIF